LVHDCWSGAVAAGYGYHDSHRRIDFQKLAPDISADRRRVIRAAVEAAAETLED
jgi:hypothetical protein